MKVDGALVKFPHLVEQGGVKLRAAVIIHKEEWNDLYAAKKGTDRI